MKTIKKTLPLVVLAGLVGCSSVSKHEHWGKRSIASFAAKSVEDPAKLQKNMDKLMEGIFHSYMIGQLYLYDFDKQLDKNPDGILKSDTYNSLLAVRSHVDKFEHEMNDMYLQLVMVTALPEFTPAQKELAQNSLDRIGKFMGGLVNNKQALPDNLQPLILGSLRDKQTHLFEELEEIKNTSDLDEEAKQTIYKNQVLLRATRMQYHKSLSGYKVNRALLLQVMAREKSKTSYRELKESIDKLSEHMKEFTSELDRGTSSDEVYPSAGPNGNLSGRTYPANTWSLTFDDGPGKTSPEVLDNLTKKNIKATFFQLAQQVITFPATANQMKDAGHDMASHSYTHAQLTKVGPAQLDKEITVAKQMLETILGVKIKLFRLPYGAGTGVSTIRNKIAENNMIHVFWTVDTLDWQDKNPQSIYERTLKQMNASSKNAGIILFHDIHRQTVTASAMVMDYLNSKKLKACTVQGVVDQMNNNLESCK